MRLDKPDFIGREALFAIKQKGLGSRMCALTMQAAGNLYGGESIYAGNRLVERIRTAAYGHTIGKDIGLAYLPPELAKAGPGSRWRSWGNASRRKSLNCRSWIPRG